MVSVFGTRPAMAAGIFGFEITRNYRESYNMFACSGILFNHESWRRSIEFVTRKITNGVAKIHLGLGKNISLGNIESYRDWSDARDMVKGMWMILQHNQPEDFVLASGKSRSIRDFLDISFKQIGIDNWQPYIIQEAKNMRPTEVDYLLGDASKAKNKLGWTQEINFEQMVNDMIKNDIDQLKHESQ